MLKVPLILSLTHQAYSATYHLIL